MSCDADMRARFGEVFFLDASDQVALENGLKAIGASKSGDPSVAAARAYLQSQQEWLLIFDNADDTSLDLRPYLQWSHGNMIITSRNDTSKEHAPDSHFEIDKLDVEDAVQLLRGVEGSSADERITITIVEVSALTVNWFL
jgi:hypothetical protein